MIRMNVYLSIAGIGIGTSTAVAGFYGMNLISGLEESPTAFYNVILTTTTVGTFIGAVCFSYISGFSMKQTTMEGINKIALLDGALRHLNSIDYAMKHMVSKQQHIDKDELTKLILKNKPAEKIRNDEIEMLFDALDSTKDGMLYSDDFKSLDMNINTEKKKDE